MTRWRGSWLVDLANADCLMMSTRVIGDQGGPPRWVQCTADRDDRWPAARVTVVRREGETCAALFERVLQAMRDLKRVRGLQYPVTMVCFTSAPPADTEQRDRRFNIRHALWKDADDSKNPATRVQALSLLHELAGHRGDLPPFKVQ